MSERSAHLNETDNYGPAFMRVAAALGEYDTTREDAAAAIELLGLAPGARVLDAGCGFGRFAAALSDQGCETVGVDISPAAIAEAERRCPGPTYLVADLTEPLPDGRRPVRRPPQHVLELRLRRHGRGGRGDAARLPPGAEAGRAAV